MYIFKHTFNLTFHTPRSDTCDNFKITIAEGENNPSLKETELYKNAVVAKEVHLRHAEKAKEAKNEVKNNPKATMLAICYDLQKTLPTSSLTTESTICSNCGLTTLMFTI